MLSERDNQLHHVPHGHQGSPFTINIRWQCRLFKLSSLLCRLPRTQGIQECFGAIFCTRFLVLRSAVPFRAVCQTSVSGKHPVREFFLDARRVRTKSVPSTTTMSDSQDFTIKVQAEEAKKKEKPLNDKPDFKDSSKLLKDGKADEGEELVRDIYSLYIPYLIYLIHAVGGRPSFEGTA